jgi:hypothetical protein
MVQLCLYLYQKDKDPEKNSLDLATVKIGLNIEENDGDVLSDVKAVTYNLENNTISSVAIDKNDIYHR